MSRPAPWSVIKNLDSESLVVNCTTCPRSQEKPATDPRAP